MGGAAGYSVLPSVNCPVGAIIITVVVISNFMAIAASGLGSSAELKDLLFYLSDTCRHSDIGYTRNEQGTLVIPRLLPSTSWHCTRQDDWTFQQSHWALPHV